MRISKRDQKLLLILFGLAVFLVSYLVICDSYNNKKAGITAQTEALQPRLDELRGYYSNLESYQKEIDRIESSVNSNLSQYPTDVRSEDMIMYANELEDKLGISVDELDLKDPQVVAQFSVPKKTADSYKLVPVAAMQSGIDIKCHLNYQQMKKLINYIYNNSKQTTIDKISVSFDAETGGLIGTVTLEKYFVSSSDYKYTQTEIPTVKRGTDDPFGTFKVVAGSTEQQKTEPDTQN